MLEGTKCFLHFPQVALDKELHFEQNFLRLKTFTDFPQLLHLSDFLGFFIKASILKKLKFGLKFLDTFHFFMALSVSRIAPFSL
jgi:hypothetical protein